MLKIQNIKYPIEKDEVVSYDKLIDYIYKHISKKYKPKNLCNVELVKKSLDARTPDLSYVLSAVFSCSNEQSLLKNKTITKYTTPKEIIELNNLKTKIRRKVLVVGMGPAGLFNAYILNKVGIDVTLIEKGSKVEERIQKVDKFFETGILDEDTNIQFGEGGAGTFSDGKLNFIPKFIKNDNGKVVVEPKVVEAQLEIDDAVYDGKSKNIRAYFIDINDNKLELSHIIKQNEELIPEIINAGIYKIEYYNPHSNYELLYDFKDIIIDKALAIATRCI